MPRRLATVSNPDRREAISALQQQTCKPLLFHGSAARFSRRTAPEKIEHLPWDKPMGKRFVLGCWTMLASLAVLGQIAGGQATAPGPATAPSGVKPSPPTAPDQSVARLHVKNGYVAELMASEPLAQDPVAMAWGPDGKLWVVEMIDYPLGKNGNMEPSGRVVYLESSKGDGHYDKATVFAENLPFPNGILPWRKGVIVTAAPDVLYLEDTTGSGKADKREVLFTGFTAGNPQLRVNTPTFGLDNWVYLANGLTSRGMARSMKTGAEVNTSGHDIRIRPDEGLIEDETGISEYGRREDDWGNWLGSDNSHPVRHFVIPERYAKRNASVQLPRGYDEAGLPPNGKVYPVSKGTKRYGYAFFEQSGHFTSACSITPYRDDLLFGDDLVQSGIDHVFICEPAHNLIQHLVLKPSGTTFVAERAEDESFNEFLASEDDWCRPVFLANGPDGALWMVDMYRFFIDHPDFLPPDGRQDMGPYYRLGDGMGRIYRIYPKGKTPRTMPRLDKLNTAELVAALESPSGWQRDTVRMMLDWRNDPAAAEPLEKLAKGSTNALTRMAAICALDSIGKLSPELVEHAMRDPSPPVRRQALRLAEMRAKQSPQLIEAAAKLADDPSAIVRQQLAFTLGEWDSPVAGKALAEIAVNAGDDVYLTAAVMSSAQFHYRAIADALIAANKAGPATRDLLGMALAQNDRDLTGRLLEPILAPRHGGYETDQMESFAQFIDGLPARRMTLRQLAEAPHDSLTERLAMAAQLFDTARSAVEAKDAKPARRIAAAALLGREEKRKEEDLSRLTALLVPTTPAELQTAAVKAMARIGLPEVPSEFIRSWPADPREARLAVLDAMLAREPWAYELLQAIAGNKILAADIDPARRQRLIRHSSQRVRTLAEKTVGDASVLSRTRVLKIYDPVYKLTGNAERGAKVFAQNCTTCHQLGGIGHEIGPNLQSVSAWTSEMLMIAILDPSRSAEPRYLSYNCTLANGEVVYGLLSRESAAGVVMKGIDALERTIPRAQIKSLECTNRSLMPDGLEAAVDQQSMADLIRYLQSQGAMKAK